MVFIQDDLYSSKVDYKEIEITKNLRMNGEVGVYYYSIHIKYLSGGEETMESKHINVIFYDNYVRLRFRVSLNGKMIKKALTVTNFDLIRLPNTTS